jgi:hypothetical protein
MALYMGPSSNFGYGGSPLQGGQPPRAPTQGNPIKAMPSPVTKKTAPIPPLPGSDAAATPPNVLGPEAVRATGPSQGYDPAYLQNMATSIGGLFSNAKQGGNVMNVNPLGNLGEISPNSGIGGTAPTQGLPLTWLQRALNGSAFGYSPTTPTTSTVKPKAPVVPSTGSMGSNGRGMAGL